MSSVLSQDWPDLEYLVVDPGSTDDTPEVIRAFERKYPGRFIHVTERDSGPADGLNKAFARATGDLFGYLNADDFYLPGCLREAARAVERFPHAGAIYGDGYTSNHEGKIIKRVVSSKFTARRFVYGAALVLQQSTFYQAAAFRKVGGFNRQNKTSWDAELLLDMDRKSMQLVHVPSYWSVFRIHSESITGSQRLSDESRRTHERYFRTVMGREGTQLDRALGKIALGYALLTEPRGLLVRARNRIWSAGAIPGSRFEDRKNMAF
jgi:glycosyltransferase involved in cell wall biosynthesis